MFNYYTEVSKHKFSWGSWVSFLDCGVLCLYLSGEAPPTSCYHGDSPSWASCLQGSEMFSAWNSVRKLELVRGVIRVATKAEQMASFDKLSSATMTVFSKLRPLQLMKVHGLKRPVPM